MSLRVLQVVTSRQRRGAEVFAQQLSGELTRRGHELRTVYLYDAAGPGLLPVRDADVELGGRLDHGIETTLGFHPGLLSRLRRTLEAWRPHVVQLNGSRTVKYGALLRRLGWSGDAVVVYRNIGATSAWVRGLRRRAFYGLGVIPGLDAIVTVSRESDAGLRAAFPRFRGPIEHIPNAVAPREASDRRPREDVRRAHGVALDAPLALFVGSLTPEKRPDRFVRLAGEVRRRVPGARFWVVGDGPLRPVLERQALAQGDADAVRFLGLQDDVASLYGAADALVLTSDTEGVPAVVLEAGLAGLPVVATRVGGLGDCVLDGETGLLVDPSSEEALAAAVARLLTDAALRARLGERAQRWVEAGFVMPVVAARYAAFFQRVLGARASAATATSRG